MDRASVRRRDRLILEARDELRKLGRKPVAREIDGWVSVRDASLHSKWTSAQDLTHRRKTILQVLRDAERPKRDRPAGETQQPPSAVPQVQAAPALVWPLGMRQRRERDPKFKLPWLLADRGGSEKLFIECIGDANLHSLRVSLAGMQVGFVPVLRPGAFVELEWSKNPDVERVATWSGWRERILNQELNRQVLQTLSKTPKGDSALADLQRSFAELAEESVSQVERVMPKDLNLWKRHVHRFTVEIRYIDRTGKEGSLRGELQLDMERQWFLFVDREGNATPIH